MRRLEARLSATEAQGRISGIDVQVVIHGALDDRQLATLRAAADSCRISRALAVPLASRLTLA